MAPAEMKKLQGERLCALVKRAYDHVPYYRAKMERAGLTPADIRGMDDLYKLPFTTKQDLRDAYPYINYAVYKKWIGGYPDGTFRPDESITRAEAVQVTNRMLERSPDKSYIDAHSELLHRFIDLAPEHWAYYEIMEAANRHNCTVEDGERWT